MAVGSEIPTSVYELECKLTVREARIAQLEAALVESTEMQSLYFRQASDLEARNAELEAQLLDAELATGEALNQLDNAEWAAARIEKLEAQLAFSEELQEAQLRTIDKLEEQLAIRY